MFLEEGRLSARLHHPNVVQTNAVGFDGTHHYLEMEYLEGQSFDALTRRAARTDGRPLPVPLAVHVLAQTLAGLHYAHELRDLDGSALALVHRDVSPHNVFVTYAGEVKLLDFGIARAAGFEQRDEDGLPEGEGHVHGAGAGGARGARSARRHLRDRRDALGSARRKAPLGRPRRLSDLPQAPQRVDPVASNRARRRARRARGGVHAGARAGACEPLRDRGRDAGGARVVARVERRRIGREGAGAHDGRAVRDAAGRDEGGDRATAAGDDDHRRGRRADAAGRDDPDGEERAGGRNGAERRGDARKGSSGGCAGWLVRRAGGGRDRARGERRGRVLDVARAGAGEAGADACGEGGVERTGCPRTRMRSRRTGRGCGVPGRRSRGGDQAISIARSSSTGTFAAAHLGGERWSPLPSERDRRGRICAKRSACTGDSARTTASWPMPTRRARACPRMLRRPRDGSARAVEAVAPGRRRLRSGAMPGAELCRRLPGRQATCARARELDPDSATAIRQAGLAFARLGDEEGARAAFESASACRRSRACPAPLMHLEAIEGQCAEALANVRRTISMNRASSGDYGSLASLLLATGSRWRAHAWLSTFGSSTPKEDATVTENAEHASCPHSSVTSQKPSASSALERHHRDQPR